MVHFKPLFTSLVLLILLIFASSTTTGSAAATGVVGSRAKSHRVNHGSFRGPRKHLLNPAVEHPLQLPKLTV
ncbi:hypothetical protein HRI_004923100 [Hibiscus trionum]|uniref:Uncharacterized protein n=1 Tax=Hibiscus trionum TaxID=183268 RepID=A0A9W7JJ28_HIBTR|nr:hypothetical protein HRI_004923100 [Hibiscus trionum]